MSLELVAPTQNPAFYNLATNNQPIQDEVLSLYLNVLSVTSLSNEIKKHPNLKKLILHGFTHLPQELWELDELEELEVNSGDLTELSPEIENLANLKVLNLSGNQLTELPSEIWTLLNLVQRELA